MSEEKKDLTSHGQIQTKAPVFATVKRSAGEIMHVDTGPSVGDPKGELVQVSAEDPDDPERLETEFMYQADYKDLLKQQPLPGFEGKKK